MSQADEDYQGNNFRHTQNPKAGTTPSTDLDKILNDFEIVQYYGKTDPKDDLTPTKAVLKAKLTEVITQERNKAWEEATAKFEACLPEKKPLLDGHFNSAKQWNETIDQSRDSWYKGGES